MGRDGKTLTGSYFHSLENRNKSMTEFGCSGLLKLHGQLLQLFIGSILVGVLHTFRKVVEKISPHELKANLFWWVTEVTPTETLSLIICCKKSKLYRNFRIFLYHTWGNSITMLWQYLMLLFICRHRIILIINSHSKTQLLEAPASIPKEGRKEAL